MSDGKGRPDSPTFVISWSFRVGGHVEPRSIVNALYSDVRGLLDDGRGLEDLVEGGDVEATPYVHFTHENDEVEGRIHAQTRMDRKRTATLAAALETIDRVGPYDAEIETEKIKFTSGGKKRLVKLRASEILQEGDLWVTELPPKNEPEAEEVT